MTQIFVIRWNKNVRLPDGTEWYMQAKIGSRAEVEEYAEQIARENDAEVMAIV